MAGQGIELLIEYEVTTRFGRFTGGGTFQAKETIKTLGRWRWNRSLSAWEVFDLPVTTDDPALELQDYFPGMRISVVEFEGNLPDQAEFRAALRAVSPVKDSKQKPALDPATLPEQKGQGEASRVASSELFSGALAVNEVLQMAEQAIHATFPRTILVYGVISKVNFSGGRAFIDLSPKDQPGEAVSCVIWSGVEQVVAPLKAAGFQLEQDLEVMFAANVSFNKRRGSLTLVIVRVIPEYTVGKLAALREKTNQQLQKEGIFERNKSLSLASVPRRLVILTSAGGTVIHDFLASLSVAKFGFELFLRHVTVQGAQAKSNLLRAIDEATSTSDIDAIVLFRGGGSAAELSVFSEYQVARAVALSPVPVLSAIGHQADESSTQDVSFKSFGVPKDLGRFLADVIIDSRRTLSERCQSISYFGERYQEGVYNRLQQLVSFFSRQTEQFTSQLELRLASLHKELPIRATSLFAGRFQRMFSLADATLSRLSHLVARMEDRLLLFAHLPLQAIGRVEQSHERLELLEALVKSSAPDVQLKRGFTIIRLARNSRALPVENTEIVTSSSRLTKGAPIEIEFHDGRVVAEAVGAKE